MQRCVENLISRVCVPCGETAFRPSFRRGFHLSVCLSVDCRRDTAVVEPHRVRHFEAFHDVLVGMLDAPEHPTPEHPADRA